MEIGGLAYETSVYIPRELSPCVQEKKRMSEGSTNLDFLRSAAVLLVFCDHCLKFFGFAHFGQIDVNWIGRLGVAFFFVHTSLVLMLSLERTELEGWRLPVNFYIRRFFRLYPLSCFVVLMISVGAIPQMAVITRGFAQATISAKLVASNLTLTQNLMLEGKSILGPLWSLPIEVDMYLILPALFLLARRAPRVFMFAAWPVALAAGLTVERVHFLWRLGFLKFSPCFVPGVVAYVLASFFKPVVSPKLWPPFLALLVVAFLIAPASWHTIWVVCLVLGLAIPCFGEQTNKVVNGMTYRVAKYSYGIYLGHNLCLWIAFCALRGFSSAIQWPVFVALLFLLPYSMFVLIERPGINLGKRGALLVARRTAERQVQMAA